MLLLVTALLVAQPEVMGPYAITEEDVGRVNADGVSIPSVMLGPSDPGSYPVVIVMHGFNRRGAQHRVTAETLASHGFVVLLPDMPCRYLGGCDHDANARQLRDLLQWVVDSSPFADRADGTRRGVIGHSWGGLAAHLAASIDPMIDVVVAMDPNEDGTIAANAAPLITVPNAHVMAENPGGCNGDWGTSVYPFTGTPHLRVRVVGSGHCDPEEPGDALCPIVCGGGDGSTTPMFRRYAIGFVQCVLAPAGALTAMLASDGAALDQVDHAGLADLPCEQPVMPPADAGTPVDAGPNDLGTTKDSGPLTPDATSPPPDAGTPADAGQARPAADVGPADSGGSAPVLEEGKGCQGVQGSGGGSLMLLLGVWVVVRATRRRRPSVR